MNRVVGSGSFAQLSRSLLATTKLNDENDPDAKAMFRVKSNLPSSPAVHGDTVPVKAEKR